MKQIEIIKHIVIRKLANFISVKINENFVYKMRFFPPPFVISLSFKNQSLFAKFQFANKYLYLQENLS